MSYQDLETKMIADGWEKKTFKNASQYRYFYYKYVKTGKVLLSHRWDLKDTNTFWVKSVPLKGDMRNE